MHAARRRLLLAGGRHAERRELQRPNAHQVREYVHITRSRLRYALSPRFAAVWYSCGHPNHCQAGHVGAINAPLAGSRTLATFRAAAEAVATDGGASFARLPANGTRAGALTRDAGVIGYLPPGAPLALPLSTMSFTGTADAPSASQSGVGNGTGGDTGGGGVWSDDRGPYEGTHYGAGVSEGLLALIVGLSVGIPGAIALIALAVWRWKLIARRRARTEALAQKLARAEESKAVDGADVAEQQAA